ncbi:MAG TPA: DUF6036 family nucleotidyltransferase, partial [Candidatus Obscuribacterales bacterium]
SYWGQQRFSTWLRRSAVQEKLQAILEEDLGDEGFHNIRSRLVTSIKKTELEQVLELLGRNIQHPVEAYIAGSVPTLVAGLTFRPTDGIDFVDEVPAEIREQRETLGRVEVRYGLTVGHVQSHYLPANWRNRVQYLGEFGKLRVYLVDPYDIFLSKLSSQLEKHLDDLRVLAQKLDKERARHLLLTDGKAFLNSEIERRTIEQNWKFIFREPLLPG